MKNELVLLACCSLHRGGEKCTVDGCDTGAREKTGTSLYRRVTCTSYSVNWMMMRAKKVFYVLRDARIDG